MEPCVKARDKDNPFRCLFSKPEFFDRKVHALALHSFSSTEDPVIEINKIIGLMEEKKRLLIKQQTLIKALNKMEAKRKRLLIDYYYRAIPMDKLVEKYKLSTRQCFRVLYASRKRLERIIKGEEENCCVSD